MPESPKVSPEIDPSVVLDQAPSIVFVKDPAGRFLYVNQRFERQFEMARADLLGKTAHDFFPKDIADAFQVEGDAALAVDHALEFEEIAPTPNGDRIFRSVKLALRDEGGNAYAVVGVLTDITERKQVEGLANEAKEDARVGRVEADRASLAKSDFLSGMSHELRTPLNAILGFAQLLGMDDLSPDQRENVNQILNGGHHLLNLVGEVLDLARIESGRMSRSTEPVHVGQALQEVIALAQPLAAKREITLTDVSGFVDVSVRADHQRFRQVLLNLLSNAIKYNREGGRVDVSSEGRQDRIRISVADNGPGVPEELLDTIFSPFERLGASATGIEGSGLGLALSRGLVEVMGGSIGARSSPGEGSVFWVEFARMDDSYPEGLIDPSWLAKDPAAGPRTILYIEDNLSNLKLVKGILRRFEEITLLTARQASAGIDLAKEHNPDLILLDLHLPDMTGEEALRRLNADPATNRIPVIVISADASAVAASRLLAFGAQAFLTKPLDVEEFLAAVRLHLSSSSLSG